MQKDFDRWNSEKKHIHEHSERRFYHVREIWWCFFGTNIGFEEDGDSDSFLRPILILKGFSKETCLVAPLTTSKYKNKYRICIGNTTGRESSAILSQIKVLDTKRFINRIAILDEKTFDIIRKSIKDML